MPSNRILVVDDEALQRWGMRRQLTSWGYAVVEADSGSTALEAYRTTSPDVVLLDLRLGAESGLDVLKAIREIDPQAAVIMVTAHGDLDEAVSGFRLGLTDFFRKPVDFGALQVALRYRLEARRLREVVNRAREADLAGEPIVGHSPALGQALDVMRKVAASNATTVLLQGESGSGKDLLAKAIHEHSARRSEPFIAVNCAALPDTLLESELFGHEKGAFTDAHIAKRGMFELADGGTLYLDEIGELKLPLQAKLLRAIESLSFRRIGATHDISVDTRIIAASNRDLENAVRQGLFRPDLFYRLSVIQIRLPPLRERREDIPALVEHFVRRLGQRLGVTIRDVTPDAMAAMSRYDWPGNVRELRNAIERALILEDGDRVTTAYLPTEVTAGVAPNPSVALPEGLFRLPAEGISLEQVEESLVRQAMVAAGGNQTRAARLLDISRDTLRYKLKKTRTPARETGAGGGGADEPGPAADGGPEGQDC